jgi:hypothetical protein
LHPNGDAGLFYGGKARAQLRKFQDARVFVICLRRGENSGLPLAENIARLDDVVRSPRCNETPAGPRVGVHGTMTGALALP